MLAKANVSRLAHRHHDDGSDGTSAVEVTYVVTPVSDEGARFAATRYGGEALLQAIRSWETSMNHYLRTGECLRAQAAH